MNYKAIFLTLAAVAAGSQPAVADDWTGAYGGLSLGSVNFNQDFTTGGSTSAIPQDRQTALGAFVGYQIQSGSLVYGAELAYSKASFPPDGTFHISDTDLSYLDLTGRIGYSVGQTLMYAKAGYSHTDVKFTGPGAKVGIEGTVIGLGIDYKMQSSMIFGVDYSVRNLSGSTVFGGSNIKVKERGDAITLRIGYQF
jgi:outer membrane immunogenic protein